MGISRAQFKSRLAGAIGALAAVAITASGIAAGIRTEASAAPPSSVRVALAGLDLSQPQGAMLLYRRLQQASSRVCGWLDQVDLADFGRWQQCYDGALQRAVLQVNAPELLAVYRNDAAHAALRG